VTASLRPRQWYLLGTLLGVLVLGYLFWVWVLERVEVPPGRFLVLTHRWGKDLPEDTIVAPNDTFQGVMLEVKPEGRHFVNPIFWGHEEVKMVEVPPGKCLVLTRKFGKELPPGSILARGGFQDSQELEEAERGILRDRLLQGSYRINPYAYEYTLVDAIEIKTEQVGVKTLKVGKDPAELGDRIGASYVVPVGYRGVQKDPVRPGTYYVNPYLETIQPVDVRSHRVELTDIEFPSRDGFILRPHVLVEYAVIPEKAPEVLIRLTDEGVLHQADSTSEQIKANEILQKIILPHMRGYARLEGSTFDARDFIITGVGADKQAVNNREKLQRSMMAKVKPRCEEVGIDIRAVTLADLVPPPDLAQQISERELARVEREKNVTRLGQYKAEQELKAAEALKQQAKEKVEAGTKLIQAKTNALQRKEVELSKLKQELASAKLKLEAAKKQAEATLTTGQAEAAVILLKNEAEVAGLRKAVQGFGSPSLYAQYHVMLKLAPAMSEIFTSDDSEFARLLTSYLTQPLPPAVPGGAARLSPLPSPQPADKPLAPTVSPMPPAQRAGSPAP
jgi:uncharacterized membrane protein YqiK